MGNNKSQESKPNNVELTNINRNINTTIHFENIYNLHDEHKQQLHELRKHVNIGVWSIFSLILLIIITVIIIFVGKKCLRKRKYKLEQTIETRAKEMALEMLENGKK